MMTTIESSVRDIGTHDDIGTGVIVRSSLSLSQINGVYCATFYAIDKTQNANTECLE